MSFASLSSRVLRLLAVLMLASSLIACQSTRTPEEAAYVAETRDPLEPLNRYVFGFNEGLDELVFKPIAWWYFIAVPYPVQDAVTRMLDNASLPWTFLNELFQGEYGRAQITATRFLINTTFGIAGIIDHATPLGYPHHSEDFGLTLARRFGMGEGPYLVLPVLGPSNPRDLTGRVVDSLGDPVGYVLPFPGGLVRTGLRAVDSRQRNLETLDELRRGSTDFYATIRSVFRQRREAEVNRGEVDPEIPRVVSQQPADVRAPAPRVAAAERPARPEQPPPAQEARAAGPSPAPMRVLPAVRAPLPSLPPTRAR